MNKQCKNCGAIVTEDSKFCQSCGSSEFIGDSVLQQNDQQPSFDQTTWQPPVAPSKPKKKTGLIIGIIVAIVVLAAGIGIVAEKAFQSQGYGQDDTNIESSYDSDSDSSAENDIEYTKGTFDGTTYTNEWADIQFVMPEGFSNSDPSVYASAESETTDCGMHMMADDSLSMIGISFEKLPYSFYDEESYLDSVAQNLEKITEVKYQVNDTYTTETIGGYAYTKVVASFENNYGTFVNSFYVRKIDDYMVVITAMGTSEAVIENLVSDITPVE